MNPIYSFQLETEYNGVTNTYTVHPLWDANLVKNYELESGQKFYRTKLTGSLTFVGPDFNIINNAAFETKFSLVIFISWDAGALYTDYWHGYFWKTDCQFDLDSKSIVVTPSTTDQYTDVIAGMEKEYDLIALKPEIEKITLAKRPLVQMYVPGEDVVSCFLSGMYWEQACERVSETDVVIIEGHEYPALTHKYFFALNKTQLIYKVEGEVNISMIGNHSQGYEFYIYEESGPYGDFWVADLVRQSDGARWYIEYSPGQPKPILPLTLQPDRTTSATNIVTISERELKVYARYLLDVDSILGRDTYELPYDDLVDNNRNYRRAISYGLDVVVFSTNTSVTPTEWGLIQPGLYYREPQLVYGNKYFPIGRSHWIDAVSIWFTFSSMDWMAEEAGRKTYVLNDAFPIYSVISVLLAQVAPGITHEATTEYSQFLYGSVNPISGDVFRLFITQKSNILAGEYTQPAQKAPITLRAITDMLRDVYQAYWYIDNGKFKIEHINWFKNGGRYTGTPGISYDLTTERVSRNNKTWAFGTSQYSFSRDTMPERYQFGWMDTVTKAFEGYPIEVLSKYVTPGNIEEKKVSNFTSDVDYMLLNPEACSQDGFTLLAAIQTTAGYVLPFVDRYVDGVKYKNQNGLLSFIDLLPKYYVYDLPAYKVKINEQIAIAYGIYRGKKQTVRFPVTEDPDPTQLIKTYIGNGQVEKLSINLSSREVNATLAFNTQTSNE